MKATKKINERILRRHKKLRTSCIHELEKSILLKCPYYPAKSVDSV
jgi:hypothetical protein